MMGRIGGAVGPGAAARIDESTRMDRRRVLHPRLGVVQGRGGGAVTGLALDPRGDLLLVVLDDGSARLWDLQRGVQLGGGLGGDVLAGALPGGAGAEAVAVRRNGALDAVGIEGDARPLGRMPAPDREAPPVLSADGSAVAYRDGGFWRVTRNGRPVPLADADPGFRPILSPRSDRVVWRAVSGALTALDLSDATPRRLAPPGGCGSGAAVTVGAFVPGGERLVLGDDRGNVCAWSVSEQSALALAPRRMHNAAVRALAIDRGGALAATVGEDGSGSVWSAARAACVGSFGAGVPGPLALDASRAWVLVGGRNGTVTIHSWENERIIARLISTRGGWAVLDPNGRFDGTQTGVDALVWTGEAEAVGDVTLPVESFSEEWFEPGLLTRLDDDSPRLLNEDAAHLPDDGFIAPPAVSIDPPGAAPADLAAPFPVTVRLVDRDYPLDRVEEVRLYRNDRLVPFDPETGAAGDGVFGYSVRLQHGRNVFHAIGVGPNGIESRPSPEAVVTARATAAPSGPRMRVVSVGVNEYAAPLSPLFYGRNDATAVSRALREQGRTLFGEVDVALLLDSDADATALEGQIASTGSPSAEDVLVVFFAGHGLAVQEADRWEWYLLPFTGTPPAGMDYETMFREHGVSSRRLMEWLTRIHAGRVVLILDSCRSGAVVESMEAEDMAFDDAAMRKRLRNAARVGGLHVLAAARANEDAVELESVPHGALTHLLLEGLGGDADRDGNRRITVKELLAHATIEMPLLSRRLGGESISQMPVGYSRGDDFALAGSF